MDALARGRWDLTVHHPDHSYPSWADLQPGGGSFVGEVGSARPITWIEMQGECFAFRLPKQYEGRETELSFRGTVEGDRISGECLSDDGHWIQFEGKRAPDFAQTAAASFGEPIELIGEDFSNWRLRSPDWVNNWTMTPDGIVNSDAGSDLITLDAYTDFRLVAEYRYPKGSNSGIYLRGRYEFQVLDDFGDAPHVGGSGAIYGFLVPKVNSVKPHDEWNVAEITLVGRTITVVLNGETIHDAAEIPGITGGALDSGEGAPGPIFVQGDHGPVTYRRLTLYPAL